MMKSKETALIPDCVKWAYSECPEIVEKWHVTAGKGLESCIKRTVEDFQEMDTLQFYMVLEDNQMVGYFGREYQGRHLPTIFVHPKYRDRKKEFWKLLQGHFLPEFSGGIYKKNLPCFNYYSKMGFLTSSGMTPDGEIAMFLFNRRGK